VAVCSHLLEQNAEEVVVQDKKPFFLMLCDERIGLRYYDFAQEGARALFLGERKSKILIR